MLISLAQAVSNAVFVLCAAPFGLVVVSCAILLRQLLIAPYILRVLWRRCGIRPRFGAAIGPSLAASLLMGGAVAWIGAGLEHRFGPLVALPIAIAARLPDLLRSGRHHRA